MSHQLYESGLGRAFFMGGVEDPTDGLGHGFLIGDSEGLGDIGQLTCPAGYGPDPTDTYCVVSTGIGCDPSQPGCNYQCPTTGVWTSSVSLCPGAGAGIASALGLSGVSSSTLEMIALIAMAFLLVSNTGGRRR
jgi:hypothetical protein